MQLLPGQNISYEETTKSGGHVGTGLTEPLADVGGISCSEKRLPVDSVAVEVPVRPSRSQERQDDLHMAAARREKCPDMEPQPCHSPAVDAGGKAAEVSGTQQTSNSRSEASTSEHDIPVNALDVPEHSEENSNNSRCAQADEMGALSEDTLSAEHSKEPSFAQEDAIENDLHRWMVDGEYHGGHMACRGMPKNLEENWCPSHEFEYWAVEVSLRYHSENLRPHYLLE